MKKQTGIWMDSKQAVIITLEGENEKTQTIESNLENRVYHDDEGNQGSFMGGQHLSQEKKFEEKKKHQMNDYVNEIISYLGDSEQIYLFGPAEAKLQLKHALEGDKTLAEKLMKVETADKMTVNQIVEQVKTFFKK